MGFFVLIIFAIVVFSLMSGKAAGDQWKTAADHLHLRYEPGAIGGVGSIHGALNGNRVSMTVLTKRSGNSSRSYTRYQMDYRNPLPVDLKIVRQGMFQELGKAFGLQDIEVGNPNFDDYLIVKGTDSHRVRAILSVPVQSAITDLLFSFNNITITGSSVEVVESGRVRESATIIQTLRQLEEFCETIMEADEKSSAGSYEIDTGKEEVQFEPEVEPPEIPYIPSISFDPFSIPSPVVVTEGPPEPIEMDEAEEFCEEDIPPIPIPSEHAGPSNEPNAEEVSLEETMPQTDAATSVAENLLEVAQQLFGDSESSLQVSKLFNEHFKDSAVAGTGKVVYVGKFSYDPIFADTRGVKATYEVCMLAGNYSKIRVVAEVMYPEDEFDRLTVLQEQDAPINGTLIAHDSIMHRLYIVAQ